VGPEGHGNMFRPSRASSDYGNDPWVEPGFSRAPLTDHTEVIVAVAASRSPVGARLREAGFTDIRIIDEAGDSRHLVWNRYRAP